MLDTRVPARWQLPYINGKLWLQGAREEEISWLRRLLPKADGIAIDVGANVGLYSYHLARLCKRVEAFEPNQDCLNILQSYAAPNIRVHCIALSSGPGVARLNIPIVNGLAQTGLASFMIHPGSQVKSLDVVIRDLDSYAFKNVCFMKVDVEGHELEVLSGAEKTIGDNRPILLLEIEQRHHAKPMKDIFEWVRTRGYEGHFLYEGWQPLSRFDIDFHQRGFMEGRQRVKYVNNFFFLPVEAGPPVGAALPSKPG